MTLSIIIVSYNVKGLLEQCLSSVLAATVGINTEVIVVDNNSRDGSIEYLGPLFPHYRFIRNDINAGFSKACNQGLRISTGEYVLFLNPDTIVPEDCFELCIGFMHQHTEAGALGVRMINGRGYFLKESKRGFPGPFVSLWKMTGLTDLFPRSSVFSQYYLGQLSDDAVQEIDVISGAFFLCRKAVLDIIGGFDEQFFMYAEDIDLSYRIKRAGYKNFYLPRPTILHYKGESTIKNADYVKQFYKAMRQFSSKHMRSKLSKWIVQGAIKVKTSLALSSVKPVEEKNYTVLRVDREHTIKELLLYMEERKGFNYRIDCTPRRQV